MFFGRNEECGCAASITAGPSEPPDSLFKDKVRIGAYPCRERYGVMWTYMGPALVRGQMTTYAEGFAAARWTLRSGGTDVLPAW